MIKAEDLRIGDLVKVRGSYFFEEGEICKVEAVDSCSYGKKIEGGYIMLKGLNWSELLVGYYKDYREIDPIPLTPEILEKNGFNMREDTVAYAKTRLGLKPLGDNKGYQVGLGSLRFLFVKARVIKYVHELQHILWALGLDANLKI